MSTSLEKIAAVGVSVYNASQLDLIRRTVAKDTTSDEFSMFIEVCRRTGLDPFRKQIYAVVYSKDNPEKRRMSIIVGIDGLRALAARCRDYRPDDDPPVFIYDEAAKSNFNHLGIVSCAVKAYKRDEDGRWFPVVGVAYWDEFVPATDVFATNESGRWMKNEDGDYIVARRKLPATSNWAKMPRVMIAKVAESIALRKGWPEELGGVYSDEEVERSIVKERQSEMTAAEEIEHFEREQRIARLGGPSITFMFSGDEPLVAIPQGQAADRIIERAKTMTADDVGWFTARNADSLRQLWAYDKSAALEVKKALEQASKLGVGKEVA